MEFIHEIRKKSREKNKAIVLPEWDDIRILKAANFIADKEIATPVLVGDRDAIYKQLKKDNLWHECIKIIDFNKKLSDQYSSVLQSKYAKKGGLDPDQAANLLSNKIYQGALLLDTGEVDGMVAGINTTTADVVRTSFRIIGLDTKYQTASSFFVMLLPTNDTNDTERVLIFADCAIVVEPDANQLVDICLATVENASHFLSSEPTVAMLSFSTEGSASHHKAQKIAQATQLIKKQKINFNVMGEVQFDAALYKEVAQIKLKNQKFISPANILIFPDLNSGNIGYKICQRLAGAKAIGPLLQGFKLPVNDLSRGASVDDIVNLVALTSLQSR